MTSSHHYDVDAEKQRYSSELAAYTRRQWDVARRSLELNQSSPQAAQSNGVAHASTRDSQFSDSSRSSQGQSFSSAKESGIADDSCAGIQSHDYAQRSHRRGGSLAHENRAIAA